MTSRWWRRYLGVVVTVAALAAVGPFPAGTAALASRAQGEAYNYAPASRTVAPVAIEGTRGTVTAPQNVLSGASTRLSGAGSYVALDFGKEVGGLVTLRFAGASGAGQQVGLAFTE